MPAVTIDGNVAFFPGEMGRVAPDRGMVRRSRDMNDRGDSRTGIMVLVAILVIALVTVLVMWQRDRESQDVELDVDIGMEIRTTDVPA